MALKSIVTWTLIWALPRNNRISAFDEIVIGHDEFQVWNTELFDVLPNSFNNSAYSCNRFLRWLLIKKVGLDGLVPLDLWNHSQSTVNGKVVSNIENVDQEIPGLFKSPDDMVKISQIPDSRKSSPQKRDWKNHKNWVETQGSE